MQYLDGHHVHDFQEAFRETAQSNSIFRFVIRIRDDRREDRGSWEFKAAPIGGTSPVLYSGFFSPVDDAAKVIAVRAGWFL